MSGKKKGRSKNKDGEAGNGSLPVGRYGEMFQEYKLELDASQDKRERLVKLSRDCTIHSKRAIFTLHHFSGGEEETKAKVLDEVGEKFSKDILPILCSIREEIGDEDPYRYHRAYSPGLQEFIEALGYFKYLKSGRLISFQEAQDFLTFQQQCNLGKGEEVEKSDLPKQVQESSDNRLSLTSSTSMGNGVKSVLHLIPSDFILGLADLTGELMRLCINAVGSGNRELPFALLPFFRALFCGFHSLGSGVRYMNQKMAVFRSSLGKVENVCYTLTVRGSEIPKQMLMDVISTATAEHGES